MLNICFLFKRFKDFDECEAQPCWRGTCIDLIGNFTCQCDFGWTGYLCDVSKSSIPPIVSIYSVLIFYQLPLNYKSIDLNSISYSYLSCSPDINDCQENFCMNGATCVDGEGFYTCVCPIGFTGQYCESSKQKCYILVRWLLRYRRFWRFS